MNEESKEQALNCITADNIHIGDVHHHITNIYGAHCSAPTAPSAKSIDTVGRVTQNFVERQAYLRAKNQLDGKTVSVLHLHGMPGSGKSEIVRKLGADFSGGRDGPFVKWHIECSDNNHKIKVETKKLLESMVKNNLVFVEEGVMETALESMNNNRCQQYVDILASCQFPILIVVEDPKEEDREFLNNFLDCVTCVTEREPMLHVYVTSQSKSICPPLQSVQFVTQEIGGLQMEEGLAFLRLQDNSSEVEKKAASQIIQTLSGSPLGLLAVKAAQPDSYQEYLENIENESLVQAVFENESEQIKELNQKQRHLYKAILLLLKPNTDDKKAQRRWKAICSLSMFHHGYIPQIVVKRVMHYLREEEEDDIDKCAYHNKEDAKDFNRYCLNFCMCKEDAGNLWFHQVVFRALRIGQTAEYEPSLRVAIKAVASIVHKDLRKSEDFRLMGVMFPHVISVLNRQTASDSDILLQFCRAHLHEVIGSFLGTNEEFDVILEAEQDLTEAITLIINVIAQSTENCQFALDLITKPGSDGTVNERAKYIVDLLHEAGKEIFSDRLSIEQYISIGLHPKSNEIDHYRKFSHEYVAEYLKRALKEETPLHPQKLSEFCHTRLFLQKDKLCSTYLAERITSILHSMSRLIICYKDQMTSDWRKRFQWCSTLCLAVCDEVYQRFEISFIYKRINASASVRIRLKGLKLFTESERCKILVEAKDFVQQKLLTKQSREAEFYEYGILKEVGAEEHDALTHMLSLVCINTKLISLRSIDHSNIDAADEVCRGLYKSAKANMEWRLSYTCILFCGKYWAAKGEYTKAFELFEDVLGGDPANTPQFFALVCYNHARAVLGSKLSSLAEYSKTKCQEALEHRSEIEIKLVGKIEEHIGLLELLLFPQST